MVLNGALQEMLTQGSGFMFLSEWPLAEMETLITKWTTDLGCALHHEARSGGRRKPHCHIHADGLGKGPWMMTLVFCFYYYFLKDKKPRILSVESPSFANMAHRHTKH